MGQEVQGVETMSREAEVRGQVVAAREPEEEQWEVVAGTGKREANRGGELGEGGCQGKDRLEKATGRSVRRGIGIKDHMNVIFLLSCLCRCLCFFLCFSVLLFLSLQHPRNHCNGGGLALQWHLRWLQMQSWMKVLKELSAGTVQWALRGNSPLLQLAVKQQQQKLVLYRTSRGILECWCLCLSTNYHLYLP